MVTIEQVIELVKQRRAACESLFPKDKNAIWTNEQMCARLIYEEYERFLCQLHWLEIEDKKMQQ